MDYYDLLIVIYQPFWSKKILRKMLPRGSLIKVAYCSASLSSTGIRSHIRREEKYVKTSNM